VIASAPRMTPKLVSLSWYPFTATKGSITTAGNAGKLTYQRSVRSVGPVQRRFAPPTSRTQAQSSRLGSASGSRSSRPSRNALAW
jgi:hypothetical protein